MSEEGSLHLLKLIDKGIHVKATGFGRVEQNVENALKSIYETNPDALMFGTDFPSTRTKRSFEYGDIELIQHLFDEQATDKILYTNALKCISSNSALIRFRMKIVKFVKKCT